MAKTSEQYLENCITLPPLPQKPSITEQFLANFAVYSAIISGVTDHQPIYNKINKKMNYFHGPLIYLHRIWNNNNIFDTRMYYQVLIIYFHLGFALF